MHEAADKVGRKGEEISILPVTKGFPCDAVTMAVSLGFAEVGENYVQEAQAKASLAPVGLRWNLIGHLQRNKAKSAIGLFDTISSVDSLVLAKEIERRAGDASRRQRILIELRTSDEVTKTGADKDEATRIAEFSAGAAHLCLCGVMTVAPLSADEEAARKCFARARRFSDSISALLDERILSFGMSDDFRAAIAEGSTQIRVGRALFGERLH